MFFTQVRRYVFFARSLVIQYANISCDLLFFETYLHFFLIFYLYFFFWTKYVPIKPFRQQYNMSQIFCLFKNIFNSDQERADFLYFFVSLRILFGFWTVGTKLYIFFRCTENSVIFVVKLCKYHKKKQN